MRVAGVGSGRSAVGADRQGLLEIRAARCSIIERLGQRFELERRVPIGITRLGELDAPLLVLGERKKRGRGIPCLVCHLSIHDRQWQLEEARRLTRGGHRCRLLRQRSIKIDHGKFHEVRILAEVVGISTVDLYVSMPGQAVAGKVAHGDEVRWRCSPRRQLRRCRS